MDREIAYALDDFLRAIFPGWAASCEPFDGERLRVALAARKLQIIDEAAEEAIRTDATKKASDYVTSSLREALLSDSSRMIDPLTREVVDAFTIDDYDQSVEGLYEE
jgi:hypothetical protein